MGGGLVFTVCDTVSMGVVYGNKGRHLWVSVDVYYLRGRLRRRRSISSPAMAEEMSKVVMAMNIHSATGLWV